MSKELPPIFLLGSERSGTNLLRKLLMEHQKEYFAPSPPHILKHLYEKQASYGDLADDRNLKLLLDDMIGLCKNHFSPWVIEMDPQEIIKGFNKTGNRRNIVLIKHYLFQIYAESQGRKSYFCKDNNMANFCFEIKYNLPDTKWVYLYRDPRDVLLSEYKREITSNNFIVLADKWKTEQKKCISAVEELKSKEPGTIFMLSYEDLISDEQKSIKNLCQFLDVDYQDQKYNVHIASGTCYEWQNLHKPTIKNNAKKYKKELSKKNIQIIESSCAHQMNYLNYNCDYPIKKIKRITRIWKKIIVGTQVQMQKRFKKKGISNREQLIHKINTRW